MIRYVCALIAAALIVAATAVGAQTAPAPASVAGAQLLNLVWGMGLVLALIAACAWLVKRLAPRSLAAGGIVRVVAGAAVGQRERVVVVEVGDSWLVLGVAPGQVTALHQMPRAVGFESALPASKQPPFAAWLKKFMDQRNAR